MPSLIDVIASRIDRWKNFHNAPSMSGLAKIGGTLQLLSVPSSRWKYNGSREGWHWRRGLVMHASWHLALFLSLPSNTQLFSANALACMDILRSLAADPVTPEQAMSNQRWAWYVGFDAMIFEYIALYSIICHEKKKSFSAYFGNLL